MIYDIRHCMCIYVSQMPPQVICRLRGPPSWARLECNRLLSLGRTSGVVTLSRLRVSCDRLECSARRDLTSKFYQFNQTMVNAGMFPSEENSSHSSKRLFRLQYLKDSGFKIQPEYYVAFLNVSVVLFGLSNKSPENTSRRKPAGIFSTLSGSLHIARYNNR